MFLFAGSANFALAVLSAAALRNALEFVIAYCEVHSMLMLAVYLPARIALRSEAKHAIQGLLPFPMELGARTLYESGRPCGGDAATASHWLDHAVAEAARDCPLVSFAATQRSSPRGSARSEAPESSSRAQSSATTRRRCPPLLNPHAVGLWNLRCRSSSMFAPCTRARCGPFTERRNFPKPSLSMARRHFRRSGAQLLC